MDGWISGWGVRYRAPYSATWSIKFNIFHKIDINSINLTTLSKLKLHLGDQSALRFKLGLKSFFLQRLLHWANNIDTVPLQTNPKRKKLEQEDDFEPKILKLPLIYRQAPSLFAAGRLLGPWQPADRWIIIMIVIIIIKRSLSVCLCIIVIIVIIIVMHRERCLLWVRRQGKSSPPQAYMAP